MACRVRFGSLVTTGRLANVDPKRRLSNPTSPVRTECRTTRVCRDGAAGRIGRGCFTVGGFRRETTVSKELSGLIELGSGGRPKSLTMRCDRHCCRIRLAPWLVDHGESLAGGCLWRASELRT